MIFIKELFNVSWLFYLERIYAADYKQLYMCRVNILNPTVYLKGCL